MSSILPNILTTKPSSEEIASAAPLRTQVRDAVLKRYDTFQKELEICTEAGLSYWQTRPMKTFLESEIAWWNANIELTTQQVQTRKTSYVEKLQDLNKTLQNTLEKAIAALPADKAKTLSEKLASEEGFDDASDTGEVDLAGATASLDLSSLQKSIPSSSDIAEPPPTTWQDDVGTAAKYAFGTIGVILYICLAVRFAAFAANDLLYKPLPYRVLAFIYTFLFAPVFIPYYMYREVTHWIWPKIDGPHFESIFPVRPYDPSESLTFDKRIYGYADTPGIRAWIQRMQANETAQRLGVLQTSILHKLIQAKETQ